MFQAKEKWKDLLLPQNKLRTYRKFKESYECKKLHVSTFTFTN